MKTGRIFRKPAKIVAALACPSLLAESTRCTITWSAHQYHRPTMGAPKKIPAHRTALPPTPLLREHARDTERERNRGKYKSAHRNTGKKRATSRVESSFQKPRRGKKVGSQKERGEDPAQNDQKETVHPFEVPSRQSR